MMMKPDRSEEKKNLLMHDIIEPIQSMIWASFLKLFNFGTYQFLKNRGDESAQVSINLSSHQTEENYRHNLRHKNGCHNENNILIAITRGLDCSEKKGQ